MIFQRPIIRIPKYILVLIRTLSSFPRPAIQDSLKFRIPCWEIPYSGYWMPLSGTWGAFHSLELTGQQTIPTIMRISLLLKTNQLSILEGDGVPTKTLGKKHFSFSKWLVGLWSGPPVLTFWKSPQIPDSNLKRYAGFLLSPGFWFPKAKNFPDFRIRGTLHGASYRSNF